MIPTDTPPSSPVSRTNSRQPSLRLDTSDALLCSPPDADSDSDVDSLFDEVMHDPIEDSPHDLPTLSYVDCPGVEFATTKPPHIPGLFFEPTVLSQTYADEVMHLCLQRYFREGHDQVMLFERLVPTSEGVDPCSWCTLP